MNRKYSRVANKRTAKRRKLTDQPNELQSSHIFKLPVELLEYIFDFLPEKDVYSVAKTCKWLQKVAIQFYQQNYSGFTFLFRSGYLFNKPVVLDPKIDQLFIKIIDKIDLDDTPWHRDLQSFCKRNWQFQQLKELILQGAQLTNIQVKLKRMLKLLHNLEYLYISQCNWEIEVDHVDNFLRLTPNLKYLSLTRVNILIREYPTLERFEIALNSTFQVTQFLKLNSQIRSFGMSSINLWDNRHSLKGEQNKLDDLVIYIDPKHNDCIKKLRPLCELLNDLHFRGLYKRLKIYVIAMGTTFNQKMVDELTKLKALTKVFVGKRTYLPEHFTLSALKYLEDIDITDSRYIKNPESLANSLENLERIRFARATPDHVMLFTSQHPKLTKMRVDFFFDANENLNLNQILRLSAMNQERAKLRNAKKVTLYVQEDVYLATKRAKRETNFDFIKLQRHNFYLWENDFRLTRVIEDQFLRYNRTKSVEWTQNGRKIEYNDIRPFVF